MSDTSKIALVIDDNANNRILEKDLLEVAGFEVFEAEDASSGMAIAKVKSPDIIIMDIRLPDMRGSDAARLLRLDPATCDIPIVFVTASVMADGREEIMSVPNTAFIGKPIDTRTFAQTIGLFMQKKKAVILIVDDQLPNLELLEARLAPEGYGIVMATSGDEALERLANNNIDLILLDVMMPGMDGFEVIRRLRQESVYKLLPIILVTALREVEDRVKGIEAGCDDFISKPVDKMELLARVRSLLKVKAYNDLLNTYKEDLEDEVVRRTGELNRALESSRKASLETMYRLARAAEYRSKDAGRHVERVSRYAAAIARTLGLGEDTVEAILFAASMHDLGKIGIPERILSKPAPLDSAESRIMEQHTTIGADILSGSDARFIMMAESIAKTHHEKWDGTGYPNALKGTQIPIPGRITAIADLFDTLTSRQTDHEPIPVEEAIEIIRKGKGTLFDPDVFDAFIATLDEILEIHAECADNPRPAPSTPELEPTLAHHTSSDE